MKRIAKTVAEFVLVWTIIAGWFAIPYFLLEPLLAALH